MYNDLGIYTEVELIKMFRFYRKTRRNKQARDTCKWILKELRYRNPRNRSQVGNQSGGHKNMYSRGAES